MKKLVLALTTMAALSCAGTAVASLSKALPTAAPLSYKPVPLFVRVDNAFAGCLKGHLHAQIVRNDQTGILDAYYPNGTYSLTFWGMAPNGPWLAGGITYRGHYYWAEPWPQWQKTEEANCLRVAANAGQCIWVETNSAGRDYCAEWMAQSRATVQSPAWATRP